MKVKDKFYSKVIGSIIAMLAIVLGISSCDDDFTTDDGSFALHYTSMTDIGTGMTGVVIASPTYKGPAPYDFKITSVTYTQGETSEPYTGDCFVINAENGAITINSTGDMKTGLYSISVSCYSAGRMYTYNNAVQVNFLKAVPEGIIVEPDFLEVKLADVMNKNSEAKFPTAQVTTENTAEHISITGYKMSNVVRLESDGSETVINNNKLELFSISDQGVISINKSNDYDKDVVKAGLYRIDLKLITMASSNLGEEEGLFVDAIRINISGAPTAISYEVGVIETGVEGDAAKPRGSFTSSKPLIEGSSVNAVYEITGIKKGQSTVSTLADASDAEKAFFSIDPATGVISVPNTHTFTKGDVFKVSVKVTNPDGEYTGEDALTLNVVEWVDPLADFAYEAGSMKQGMSFESKAATYDAGDTYVKYSLKSVPEGYEDYFSIDETTGVVKIEKYNTLPRTDGEGGQPFVVEVQAKNFKDNVIGRLEINVVENPNYFTYISYGNNLVDDQTPGSIYDNQYRFTSNEDVNSINIAPKIDVKEGSSVAWSMVGKHHNGGIKIDNGNGTITANVTPSNWGRYSMAVVFVTAKVGSDADAFERTFPVFFNYSKPMNGVTIQYTPFVLHVNPKLGGSSNAPTIKGDNINTSKVFIDYYNTNSYFNLNGVRSDGEALEDGRVDKTDASGSEFLHSLWDEYGKEPGNYSANYPISYYDGGKAKASHQNNLAYIDNSSSDNKFKLVVNAGKWNDDGWADGVFTGKFKFSTDGTQPPGTKNNDFYMAIWFDKNYVPAE